MWWVPHQMISEAQSGPSLKAKPSMDFLPHLLLPFHHLLKKTITCTRILILTSLSGATQTMTHVIHPILRTTLILQIFQERCLPVCTDEAKSLGVKLFNQSIMVRLGFNLRFIFLQRPAFSPIWLCIPAAVTFSLQSIKQKSFQWPLLPSLRMCSMLPSPMLSTLVRSLLPNATLQSLLCPALNPLSF